jgi:hypothetical protein
MHARRPLPLVIRQNFLRPSSVDSFIRWRHSRFLMLKAIVVVMRFVILLFGGHRHVALENVAALAKSIIGLANVAVRANVRFTLPTPGATLILILLHSLLTRLRGEAAMQAEIIALRRSVQLPVLHAGLPDGRMLLRWSLLQENPSSGSPLRR